MKNMNNSQFPKLSAGAHIHMVGIGGISMSALAHILIYLGYKVSGSDRCESPLTEKLKQSGVEIHIGHSADNIAASNGSAVPSLVCYTAAIPKDNPELVKAHSLGIPTLERAELLGRILKHYKFPIAVAGTHGKTTTTSMLSLILLSAQLNPTILVGGELAQIDGNYKIGDEKYLVFEACEYVESFLHFEPFMSVITNVEEDHMDYFSSLNHIISSFEKFARLNSPLGCIIVCSDDKNAATVVQNIDRKVVKYAVNDENAQVKAQNIVHTPQGRTNFSIIADGKLYAEVSLSVHGLHNVYNALGAAAAAYELGISGEAVKKGLESFTGAKRRFESVGTFDGVAVIDDYAHHPTEIESTLKAAQEIKKGDIWCVFQPHTYSRTKAFLDDFAKALSHADKAIIADIYPAREKYDGTIHSCDLAAKCKNGVYINNFDAIKRYIQKNAKAGDTVITMGAGDIYKVGRELVIK